MKLEENARNDQEQDLQIHGDMILPILCGITEMPDSICQSGSNRQGARNRYTRRQSGHHHPEGNWQKTRCKYEEYGDQQASRRTMATERQLTEHDDPLRRSQPSTQKDGPVAHSREVENIPTNHEPKTGGRRGSKRMGAKTKFYKEGTWGNPKKEEKRRGYQEQK